MQAVFLMSYKRGALQLKQAVAVVPLQVKHEESQGRQSVVLSKVWAGHVSMQRLLYFLPLLGQVSTHEFTLKALVPVQVRQLVLAPSVQVAHDGSQPSF